MALTTCPECDGQLSTSADACPHCGFRLVDDEPVEVHHPGTVYHRPATSPITYGCLIVCAVVGLFLAVGVGAMVVRDCSCDKRLEYPY